MKTSSRNQEEGRASLAGQTAQLSSALNPITASCELLLHLCYSSNTCWQKPAGELRAQLVHGLAENKQLRWGSFVTAGAFLCPTAGKPRAPCSPSPCHLQGTRKPHRGAERGTGHMGEIHHGHTAASQSRLDAFAALGRTGWISQCRLPWQALEIHHFLTISLKLSKLSYIELGKSWASE